MNFKILLRFIIFSALVIMGTSTSLFAQACDNDQLKPLPVCLVNPSYKVAAGETINVDAIDFGILSEDECTKKENLQFRITTDPNNSAIPTTSTLSFTTADIGTYSIQVWVGDEAENWDFCEAVLQIEAKDGTSCENDKTAPVAICEEKIVVKIPPTLDFAKVYATALNGGSYDDCSNTLAYRITLSNDDTPPPAEATSIEVKENTGNVMACLWVGDEAGNWSKCFSTLIIEGPCEEDTAIPIAICNDKVVVNLGDDETVSIDATLIDAGSYDFCTPDEALKFSIGINDGSGRPTTTSLDLPKGAHEVMMWVGDNAGNWNQCWTTIIVESNCGEDTRKPTPYIQNGQQFTLGEDGTITISASVFDANSQDNCTNAENLAFRIERGAATTLPTTNELVFTQADIGIQEVTIWVGDKAGNWDFANTYFTLLPYASKFIKGAVFFDANENCNLDATEQGVANQLVVAIGQQTGTDYKNVTDDSGNYVINIPDNVTDTDFDIKIMTSLNYGQNCQTNYTLTNIQEGDNRQNISYHLTENCFDQLGVNIAASNLKPCAENTYFLNYFNFGESTESKVIVEVIFDAFTTVNSATVAYQKGDNNTYTFILDPLDAGAFGTIEIETFLACEAIEGLSHVTRATIYSGEDCLSDNPLWSGASIKVSGQCDGDQIRMNIKNVGTGDMQNALDYIIVEDVLLLRSEKFLLKQDEGINLTLPSNGSTWRLQTEQERFHPGSSKPTVTVEGCGGINTEGMVQLYPQDDADLNTSVDYQQNTTASLIFNEIKAFPLGYGTAHLIDQNIPLDYMVTFEEVNLVETQQLIIELAISEYLDLAKLQTGASNLPYEFENTGTKARFIFKDLQAGSQGFFKFKIPQKTDNPIGTIIENQARLYFDDKTPMETSTVFHTVGADYVELTASTSILEEKGASIKQYPNPARESITISLKNYDLTNGQLHILGTNGQQIQSHLFNGTQVTIQQLNLPAGIYFYQLTEAGSPIHYGKFIIK